MIERYPLCWPSGWRRSVNHKKAAFKTTFFSAMTNAKKEIVLMGGGGITISSNIPLRKNDGRHFLNCDNLEDPGVAVYFSLKGKQMVFACDTWNKVSSNMQAIRKTIEALRGIERWGASDMLERAFTGFQALEAPKEGSCWSILGIPEGSPKLAIERARKKLAMMHHPDKGGSGVLMAKINNAYNEACRNI